MDNLVTKNDKNDCNAMNIDSTIIVSSNDNKRKRHGSTHCDDSMVISIDDNCNNIDSIALLEALITPNFEELARQFVEFRHAYYNVLSKQRHGQNICHTISDNQQQQNNNNNNNNDTYNSFQSCITQEFTIALTKALLHVHVNGLSINFIPNDQLCPPVPNRYYFVQWIQNILLPFVRYSNKNKVSNTVPSCLYFEEDDDNSNLMSNNDEQNTPIVGIDIGTGATCIYPLLFTATSPCEIFMYATDIDEVSINYAKENVQCNPNYSSKIHITLVPPSDQQIQYEQQQQQLKVEDEMKTTEESLTENSTIKDTRSPQTYRIGPLRQSYNVCLSKQSTSQSETDTRLLPRKIDFCMTNPPFYDSMNPIEYNEVILSNTNQRRDGRQRTVLKVSEGLYPGGEVAFILDIIVDGLYLFLLSKSQSVPPQLLLLPPEPVWSCCMIGKRTSQIRVQHILEQFLGYGHVQTTEFGPGQLTRWFLAWTFTKRPCIRSPNAKIESDTFHGTKWSFTVNTLATAIPSIRTNDNDQNEWNSMNEVLKRIEEYCSTFPGHNLCSKSISTDVEKLDSLPHIVDKLCDYRNSCLIEIWEEHTEPLSYPWPGDEILPIELQQVLETATASSHSSSPPLSTALTTSVPFLLNATQRTRFFIPRRGHFLIDMKLEVINDIYSKKLNGMISVQIIASYRHTTYGMNMIKVIKNQFEGEICRTNRKWRRKLQHHHQQPTNPHAQQVQQYAYQENKPMDGS